MPVERSPPRDSSHNSSSDLESQSRASTSSGDTILNVQQPPQQTMYDTEYLAAVSKPQLPAFMKDRPDIWFYLIEAEFAALKTRSDDIKYNSTLKALDSDTLRQITDIITTPPANNKYATLKQTVIKRIAQSRQKQMHLLLNDLVLGDKKPSQLLREMKDLAAESINEEMLHNLWVSRLPNTIRPLLVTSDTLKLDALAEMADRLIEVVTLNEPVIPNPPSTVVAVNHQHERPKTPPLSGLTVQMTELQSAMAFCMKTILDIQKQQQQMRDEARSDRRGRSHSRGRDKDRRSPSQPGLCYYHRRFGQNAERCTTPCTYNTITKQGN